MATDEQLEKKETLHKETYSKLSYEQKEMRKAYCRHQRATATEEERDRKNARRREMRLKMTDEQREKERISQQRRLAMVTDERLDKLKARAKEIRPKLTDEQREKKKAYDRRRRALQKESRSVLTIQECPVEFAPERIDDVNFGFTGTRIKSENIADEQCENKTSIKAEECTSQIGGLDYFVK